MGNQLKLFNVANHSNQGKDFEQDLEGTHDWYRLQGWADVRKIPSNWQFISQNAYLDMERKGMKAMIAQTAHGRFMQRVKSDVDFVGAGQNENIRFGIAFDAKVCSGKTFPLGNIESHQLEKLRSRDRCRMLAGAMIQMTEFDRVFFAGYKYLEFREIELLKQTGRRAKKGTASISMEELEKYTTEILRHKMNDSWDWLKILVK